MTRALSLLLVLAPATAFGGDLAIGFGAGLTADMGDRVSGEYASFKPGPQLMVPIRYDLNESARFRATLRSDMGFGSDRVTWGQTVDGQEVRFYDDDHWAMAHVLGLTVGADVELPFAESMGPYLGAEMGIASATTYHSLGDATQILLDPTQNELDNPNNIDPFTRQSTLLTDFHGGVYRDLSESLALWVEAGYSLAFLDAKELQKTPPELNARREAYGWNAVRLGLGVSIGL